MLAVGPPKSQPACPHSHNSAGFAPLPWQPVLFPTLPCLSTTTFTYKPNHTVFQPTYKRTCMPTRPQVNRAGQVCGATSSGRAGVEASMLLAMTETAQRLAPGLWEQIMRFLQSPAR